MQSKEDKSKYIVLIVEDHLTVQKLVEHTFAHYGFSEVYTAKNIKEARKLLGSFHIDLIVLDLILPDGNGLDFCKEIKTDKNFQHLKVIVLTNKVKKPDRIGSFHAGADDYLSKPFFPEELVVRAERALQLINIEKQPLKFGELTLDQTHSELYLGNILIPLTTTETVLLAFIIKSGGKVTKESLVKYLSSRHYRSITSEAVTVTVNRIRTKINKVSNRKIIETKYGNGYYLNFT